MDSRTLSVLGSDQWLWAMVSGSARPSSVLIKSDLQRHPSGIKALVVLSLYHSYRSSAPDGKHTVPSLAPSSSLLHWSPAPNPSLLQSLSVPSPKSCAPRMLCPSPPTKPSLPAALLTRPLALGALIAPCLLVLPLDLRSSWPTPGGQLLVLSLTCSVWSSSLTGGVWRSLLTCAAAEDLRSSWRAPGRHFQFTPRAAFTRCMRAYTSPWTKHG
mmetsp:Transcript_23485/g.61082  ORF Transcript_23485/g.61082 Transcript_23485/m.61082 type:complete len:214 (-) Transcript_23485:198-839(-)